MPPKVSFSDFRSEKGSDDIGTADNPGDISAESRSAIVLVVLEDIKDKYLHFTSLDSLSASASWPFYHPNRSDKYALMIKNNRNTYQIMLSYVRQCHHHDHDDAADTGLGAAKYGNTHTDNMLLLLSKESGYFTRQQEVLLI